MPTFWKVFIINGCWILWKAFSASIEMIIWFFSFKFLIQFMTLIDLCVLKNPCLPGVNPTWWWCMIFLMCCWILFASILLRIFAYIFISDIGLNFFSLWHLCLVLVSGWLWECSSVCYILEEFDKDRC